jgi:hypothetical protein
VKPVPRPFLSVMPTSLASKVSLKGSETCSCSHGKKLKGEQGDPFCTTLAIFLFSFNEKVSEIAVVSFKSMEL